MKKLLLLAFNIFFLINVSFAQQNISDNLNNGGLYLGASLQGTAWNVPDLNLDTESGGGFGLKLGYNFNSNFAAFFSVDASNIEPDQGADYTLAHADLGAEGRLDLNSNFRPFARLSLVGMSAQSDTEDIEINGGGFGLGIGTYYFLNESFGLEVGYTYSWINVNEVSLGSTTADIDENANTGRFRIGASYHF